MRLLEPAAVLRALDQLVADPVEVE